jgi:hypothetical protein
LLQEYKEDLDRQTVPSFFSDPFGREDFQPAKVRKMILPLGVAITVYSVGVYFNAVTQAWLQKRLANEYPRSEILWDVGFEFLPFLDTQLWPEWDVNWPDLLVGSHVVWMGIRFLIIPGPMSMRWTVLRRLYLISGVLFFCRGVSVVSTVLPNPDHTCECTFGPNPCTDKDLENVWRFAWHIFIFNANTCADVLFSGHTVALTMALLVILQYTQQAPWFNHFELDHVGWRFFSIGQAAQAFSTCYALVGYLFIVGSRFHYTADVLMGFLLSYFVFRTYHEVVKSAFAQDMWYGAAIRWLEADALDVKVWHKVALQKLRAIEIERESSRTNICGMVGSDVGGSDLRDEQPYVQITHLSASVQSTMDKFQSASVQSTLKASLL